MVLGLGQEHVFEIVCFDLRVAQTIDIEAGIEELGRLVLHQSGSRTDVVRIATELSDQLHHHLPVMGGLAAEFFVLGAQLGCFRARSRDAVQLQAALFDHQEFAEFVHQDLWLHQLSLPFAVRENCSASSRARANNSSPGCWAVPLCRLACSWMISSQGLPSAVTIFWYADD